MRALFLAITLAIAASAFGSAHAASCSIDLKVGDTMGYDQHSVTVGSACTEVTVRLAHTGHLPVQTMGHNVVIGAADAVQGIAQDGAQAGPAANYVKPGDPRVIAATKLVGGGQSTGTSFPGSALKSGGAYRFFCTSPGHLAQMTGQLVVQ
ncbi:MAG: azurin [Lysobacter sp.]|nr:azurin [Lysobacter sp.]